MLQSKMAEQQQLVLSAPLCFIINTLKRHRVNDVKSLIVDFYNVDDIYAAKSRLIADSAGLCEDLPRLPRRQESAERKTRECNDIFTLINFLDEKMAISKLPTYVTDNPDDLPSIRFAQGDFRFFFDKMSNMEFALKEVQDKLTGLQGTSAPAPMPCATTATGETNSNSGVRPHGVNTVSGLKWPSVHHGRLNSVDDGPGRSADHVNRYTTGASDGDDTDGAPFVEVSSRRKRRRVRSSQATTTGDGVVAAGGFRIAPKTTKPSSQPAGRPRSKVKPTSNRPLVIGSQLAQRDNAMATGIKAAKPLLRKAVYCVDNVNARFDNGR
jgi:hypothetical protein